LTQLSGTPGFSIPNLEDLSDVGMTQRRRGLGFANKALHAITM
jgi:hypothetical protein